MRIGHVARVAGVVVDVEFAVGDLPGIRHALLVEHDEGPLLVIEVQEHVDPATVRGMAMASTSGLRRGLAGQDTGRSWCRWAGPPWVVSSTCWGSRKPPPRC